jgi:hypothetical protein
MDVVKVKTVEGRVAFSASQYGYDLATPAIVYLDSWIQQRLQAGDIEVLEVIQKGDHSE